MNQLYLAYPAIVLTTDHGYEISYVDLDIDDFIVPLDQGDKLSDLIWERAAQYLQGLMFQGRPFPEGTRLEDLPLDPDAVEDNKHAMLVELTLG